MPPRKFSRYTFTSSVLDTSNRLLLIEREPFRFEDRQDNRMAVVRLGDTLFTLAGQHFFPLPRACGLWWIIADFQPTPILDPTLRLKEGQIVVIPSLRTVLEDIFSESRRGESTP